MTHTQELNSLIIYKPQEKREVQIKTSTKREEKNKIVKWAVTGLALTEIGTIYRVIDDI